MTSEVLINLQLSYKYVDVAHSGYLMALDESIVSLVAVFDNAYPNHLLSTCSIEL